MVCAGGGGGGQVLPLQNGGGPKLFKPCTKRFKVVLAQGLDILTESKGR